MKTKTTEKAQGVTEWALLLGIVFFALGLVDFLVGMIAKYAALPNAWW